MKKKNTVFLLLLCIFFTFLSSADGREQTAEHCSNEAKVESYKKNI